MVLDSFEEFLKMERVGHTTVDRGDRTPENVIISMENPQSFDRKHIEIILHHTEDIFLSFFIGTNRTNSSMIIGESETGLTISDISLEFLEFSCKVLHIGTICFQ